MPIISVFEVYAMHIGSQIESIVWALVIIPVDNHLNSKLEAMNYHLRL